MLCVVPPDGGGLDVDCIGAFFFEEDAGALREGGARVGGADEGEGAP